jgi:2-methylcitrate dehydratase PrpD
MASSANATSRLGAFVARSAAAGLSPAIASKAAICLLDALGLAIVARDENTAAAARAMITPAGNGPGTARLWADGARAAVSEAVLANGIAVHAHFQDDTEHDSWSHPGSLISPVAVSLGEATDASLATVLKAMVAGYVTMKWLGGSEVVARGLIGRGLRTSPTFGTVGAAAAAAVCLGLDTSQATSAVAIAASTTGGTLEPVRCGSDEWRVQNGRAANGGLVAAQLAVRGVQGAPDALEGPKGLLKSLAGVSAPPQWQDDPDPASMADIMAKPFATLGDNMSAALAARLVHADKVDLSKVNRITVAIWRPYTEYPGTSFKGPFERIVQTQASTAFAVCAMLVYGKLDYAMGVDCRQDPRIAELIAKTNVVPDDIGNHLDASVELEMIDGTRHSRTARESPRNLVFQDEARATEVLEQRLSKMDFARGTGRSIAAEVFASAAGDGRLPIRAVIDRLTTINKGSLH